MSHTLNNQDKIVSIPLFQIEPFVIDGQIISLTAPKSGPLEVIFGLLCARDLMVKPQLFQEWREEMGATYREDNGSVNWTLAATFLAADCSRKYRQGIERDHILAIAEDYAKEYNDAWLSFWVNEVMARDRYLNAFSQDAWEQHRAGHGGDGIGGAVV